MKKILGVFFILLGILFTILTTIALFQFGNNTLHAFKSSVIEGAETTFGGLIALGLFGFITFNFYKFGYKWLKGNNKEN